MQSFYAVLLPFLLLPQSRCQLSLGMGVEQIPNAADRNSHETMPETVEALLEVPN